MIFLIDGLNVGYWCGKPPSLRLPLALVRGLLADGHHVLCVFDASSRYRFDAESVEYDQLLSHGEHYLQVPAGQPADRELIRLARIEGGVIISRDHFSKYRKKFRKLIDDPARRIAGFVSDERIHLPSLDWSAPLMTPPA